MNQLVSEAYKNYRSKSKDIDLPEDLYYNLIDDLNRNAIFPIGNPSRMLSQEEFINQCKTDVEFSERWGLRIEERELSDRERYELVRVNGMCPKYSFEIEDGKPVPNKLSEKEWYDNFDIPTRAITVTYNNETIEVYE